ncbi:MULTISPECIES: zinc-dependent metalloprotease [Maribacter]|uniref:zinc-dependent metalloprotease n=1 Tax=Maribacter TaxID=252356 RepID=UPI0007198D05|nr:zinc-dependent metalloprotease [Maribacter dokdonensis]KSA12677.1 hypothetical protein I600_2110 [Maribacter dokdonensis DSW-8]
MKKLLFLCGCLFLFTINSTAQKKSNKNSESTTTAEPKAKKGIKPYTKVITKDAVADEGVFKVFRVKDDYFYEIPFTQLGQDMLWVSRIAQLQNGVGGGYVNAGSKTNEQVVHWIRFRDKILLKSKSFINVADSTKAISSSVKVNNYEPTIYAFDIEAFSPDSTAAVVNVTKFFNSDIPAISGLSAKLRKEYKVKKLDGSRSFIHSVNSFPENIEVKQDFTYEAAEPPSLEQAQAISLQMNQSMILLPKKPMKPRIYDPRVGFFTISQYDYGSEALKADQKTFIRRWRMEPKDIQAYERGEIVEPVKPIVYYLDPGTPENLQKYIIQGVEEWQKPFEAAGFKNAIIAKQAPTKEEDPDFSPEDVRYNMVRYVASTTRNAVGPSVSDPRSGEIVSSDIIWYHNHLRSYRNRYLLETGAANPSARTLNTDPEEIGEMMRMVIAHEIGHALGFPHNMAASFSYPVDSLRNGAFTQKYGIASSIMDYARYNYIAQPGDENIRFIRQIGPYDYYSVNWGYHWFSEDKDERDVLNSWVIEKANDPKYKFGRQSSRFDPQSQTEAIGDDPLKASTYGINNLKYVMTNLPNWTSDITNDYQDLEELYGELLGVFNRYVGHVTTTVGGVFENLKTPEQGGVVYSHYDASKQKEAVKWLNVNLFQTPKWLLEKDILKNIDHSGYSEKIRKVQVRQLNSLLSFERIGRLIDAESFGEQKYYSALEMLTDIRAGIWKESYRDKSVDLFRRNLQRSYIDRMEFLMKEEIKRGNVRTGFEGALSYDVNTSDVRALARGELTAVRTKLRSAKNNTIDKVTKYHYEDIIARIDALFKEI